MLIVILMIAGCGGIDEKNNDNESEVEPDKESVVFRQIDVIVDSDQIKVSGEVKSWDGTFYYHILQGEEIVLDEDRFTSEHIGFWTPFIIELEKEDINQLREEIPHIALYGKNEAGEQINPNYVPIDLEEK